MPRADDILQNVSMAVSAQHEKIEQPSAWLTTVVTRACLDFKKSSHQKRVQYVGPWLPEPVGEVRDLSELAQQIEFSLLVALEQLNGAERATHILDHVFDYSFQEVGLVLEKDEATCRQLAH